MLFNTQQQKKSSINFIRTLLVIILRVYNEAKIWIKTNTMVTRTSNQNTTSLQVLLGSLNQFHALIVGQVGRFAGLCGNHET